MSKVIHVIDEACLSGAVAEATLLAGEVALAGEAALVCIGPPPPELGEGRRVVRLARPNRWSAALGAGLRPLPRVLAGDPIAHCWSVSSAADLWAASGYADLKLLVRLVERPGGRELDRLGELCRMTAARVVCASESDAEALAKALGPADVRAIGPLTGDPAVPPAHRDELREQLGIGPDEAVFLAPGAMRRGSGHRRAIWAVTVLTVVELPVRLLMQAAGPAADKVRGFAERTVSGHFVAWADPAVPPGDLLAVADAALFLQDTSPPPVLLAAAMRAGVPVIAARDQAPAFLADGRNALLPPGDSPRAIAREMLRLIEEDGLAKRLAAGARATAAEALDAGAIAAAWAELYSFLQPAEAGAGDEH